MRGQRVSRTALKEIDVVLIAIRLEPESERITIAQGCIRRGTVWGDVQLLDRDSIVRKIKDGKTVVTGKRTEVQGDFEVFAPVQLSNGDSGGTLFTGSLPSSKDDLSIPFF
jgi:hypothetical protein